MDKYRKSLEWYSKAGKYSPGSAQTLSKMGVRFPLGAFPVSSYGGIGARIKSIDGDWFVDWIGALGANPLGYGNQAVNQAILERVEFGSSLSLPYAGELHLAKKLCDKIPCAESVRFVSSGSEATEAAIRTARIATGRDVILTVKSGYHSWHSWFQAVKDWHPGVPVEYEDLIRGFAYNDMEDLESCFDATGPRRVAAVIMEPCLFEKPKQGFLQDIRDLCEKYGALLIFDEMVMGYRLALAGGQEFFGVVPDLATFGKGMANGLPIGMLCGKKEYMQHAELISGTFGGNAISLAAANAVLDVYEAEPVIETMRKRGQEFQDYFNSEAYNCSVEAECIGYPCKPKINFTESERKRADINQLCMSLFLQVTAGHGMLWHPGGGNVCYALTDKDMDITKAAISRALIDIRRAVRSNDWGALRGNIIQPVVTVRS